MTANNTTGTNLKRVRKLGGLRSKMYCAFEINMKTTTVRLIQWCGQQKKLSKDVVVYLGCSPHVQITHSVNHDIIETMYKLPFAATVISEH